MSNSLLSINGQTDPTSLVPDGWRHNQLGEVCDIHGGGRLGLTKDKHYRSSGILAFSASGPDGFVEKIEFQNKAGVVLSAIGANCGRCFFAFGDWTTLSNVQAIIPNSMVDAKYLFYFVNREQYWERSGSAQPFIKPSTIRSSWIVYPRHILEQIKIAEILLTVDQAIEQTEALIAKHQRIKTGLMQGLLTRGIGNDGNLRSEETHEFKDSPLGRIPVDWKVRSINSISDFVTSGARGWAKYYSHEGAVFLRIGNLTRDHINMRLDDTVFVQPPTNAEGLRTAVLPRDVLISVTADLGIVGVIPDDFGEGYVNQHIALIRISDTEVNQRFIAWFLQSRAGQIQIERHNEAGAKAGLNLPTIRSLLVASPSSCEQGHIAQMLDTATNAISCLQTEMTKQIRLKTALMQDLLTGDVSVTPLMAKEEIGV